MKRRAKDAIQESFIFLLFLYFFLLIAHASLRSSLIYSNPSPGDDRKVLAIIGIIFCYGFSAGMVALITSSLEHVEHGLGLQGLACALFGGVVGLSWAVFGMDEQAEFRVYLRWVVWPVAVGLTVFVMTAWMRLVYGYNNKRLERERVERE